ncbi:helix-turn-helix transcriptional regulator [Streptomyces sp. TRM 70361]|uniref:helix-turn-helix domain-containing protein n=1 Tax=Streptomyces sp. TRM 70361 TaxID=3116553 RepID=UPI002E7AF1BD|nr:helix-turn-helix transcriptional regulator [Streptomyces sp. TRM 70361]MEE1939749.1 helix-turn-helix transcriptional regulator [Streptomyces sp. TRM 70361]
MTPTTGNASTGSDGMKVFGAVLGALREAHGTTQEELGRYAGYSKSMVAKIEYGERLASPDFIARAEELLEARGALLAAAPHLRWTRLPAWFGEYARLEQEAVSLWTFNTHVVHGLVQTEDYARAVLGAYVPVLEEDELERQVRTRLDRQALLTRRPAVSLSLVVEEWVLRRPVGGKAVSRAQLERLLELAGMRNVSIQLMPTHYETHAGFDGPFTLLETPERQWVAYVEGQAMGSVIDDQKKVSEFQTRYGMIRTQALAPKDSVRLIEELIRAS